MRYVVQELHTHHEKLETFAGLTSAKTYLADLLNEPPATLERVKLWKEEPAQLPEKLWSWETACSSPNLNQ